MHALIPDDAAPAADLRRALIDTRRELVNFLTRRLTCRATAEDIAQDVYLRLSGRDVAALHPRRLIFATAANLASNHRRDERRRAEIRHDLFAPEQALLEERHPERIAIARDQLAHLAAELATWPERTREIFILNRYEGFTLRDIAAKLGLSSTAIEKHMARAIVELAHWRAESR